MPQQQPACNLSLLPISHSFILLLRLILVALQSITQVAAVLFISQASRRVRSLILVTNGPFVTLVMSATLDPSYFFMFQNCFVQHL